jgi:CRP-like cAMP-binding protein
MTFSAVYAELRASDPGLCRDLFRRGRRLRLRRGELAYRQDDPANYSYLVIIGGVLLIRSGLDTDIGVDFIYPGRMCGIHECIALRRHATDARATTDTVLLRFAYDDFRSAMQRSPLFGELLLRELAADLTEAHGRLEWLTGASLKQRIDKLSEDFQRRRRKPAHRLSSLSQGDLAALLGVSRQRVNAAINARS